jgi:hypothetical protein
VANDDYTAPTTRDEAISDLQDAAQLVRGALEFLEAESPDDGELTTAHGLALRLAQRLANRLTGDVHAFDGGTPKTGG